MATRTLTKSGFLTDTTIYSGAVIPVTGDTVDLAGFDIYANKSFTGSGLIFANSGAQDAHVILTAADININVPSFGTLTNKVIFQGSPSRIENNNNTPAGLSAKGGV